MLTVYIRSPVTAHSSVWHQKTQSEDEAISTEQIRIWSGDHLHVDQLMEQIQRIFGDAELQLSADTKRNLMYYIIQSS